MADKLFPITQNMIYDWCSPEGYGDFNGNLRGYNNVIVPYQGNFAVYREEGGSFATHASALGPRKGHARYYCPRWVSKEGNEDIFEKLKAGGDAATTMLEPEFSLDEISAAKELMDQMD